MIKISRFLKDAIFNGDSDLRKEWRMYISTLIYFFQ